MVIGSSPIRPTTFLHISGEPLIFARTRALASITGTFCRLHPARFLGRDSEGAIQRTLRFLRSIARREIRGRMSTCSTATIT
jgi:hypothetical protein